MMYYTDYTCTMCRAAPASPEAEAEVGAAITAAWLALANEAMRSNDYLARALSQPMSTQKKWKTMSVMSLNLAHPSPKKSDHKANRCASRLFP